MPAARRLVNAPSIDGQIAVDPNMPQPLSPRRLEAFSDGVIAVIITIMVLELRVPSKPISDLDGLRQILPLLIVYLLSFVQTGIYWVNHHYLTDKLEHVTHAILWSNLGLLFFLSLIPFATRWVGMRGVSSFSIALYALTCALPAIAWSVLSTVIRRHKRQASASSFSKQAISSALYLSAIPAAFLAPNFAPNIGPTLALSMIALVALLWLIPPRTIAEQTQITPAGEHSHNDQR